MEYWGVNSDLGKFRSSTTRSVVGHQQPTKSTNHQSELSYPYILKPAKKNIVFPPQQPVIDCGSWKVELAREKMAGSGPPCSTTFPTGWSLYMKSIATKFGNSAIMGRFSLTRGLSEKFKLWWWKQLCSNQLQIELRMSSDVSKRSPSSSKEKIGTYTTSVLYVHVRVRIIYVMKCKVRQGIGMVLACMYVRM